MPLKALQNYTYYSRYAGYNEEAKRRETWNEAVDRMINMHARKYPEAKEEIEWIRPLIKEKRFLGSQRALQFGGSPIEKKHSRLYNCSFSYCDRIRFFQEALWMLLCGSGVGYSVQKHHIAKLPEFHFNLQSTSTQEFVIPDSIEGWADALGVLLATYLPHPDFPEWKGKQVSFDYSLIRPAGSPLSSGVGKAPGPAPLRTALERIEGLLGRCLENGQIQLRPIDAHDIILHASDAVLSGGVRRSSCIALFSPDDQEMASCKTGNWFYDNPQRARANNSAVLLRSQTTKEQFVELMQNVKEFGEPGFIWVDSLEAGFNPCVVGDTLVPSVEGMQTALNLVKKPFEALVEGKPYYSSGFWKTGVQPTVSIDFKSGRMLTLTEDHKVMTTLGWKKAKELTSNDSIVIHNHRDFNPKIDIASEDYARGYCLGNFLADGNISKDSAQMKWWGEEKDEYRKDGLALLEQANWKNNHHILDQNTIAVYATIDSKKLFNFAKEKGCLNGEKSLSPQSLEGSWSYLSGLISGYFDADGTIRVDFKKGNSVRFTSANLENLKLLQIGLNAFGIFSNIYLNRNPEGNRHLPDGKGGHQDYYCQAIHELVIACDSISRFSELILIRNKNKQNNLLNIVNGYQRMPNRTHFVDHIINKTFNGIQDVYDCEVTEVHAFDANSIYVHNCCEINLYAYDDEGNSGWAFCNLCEINGKKIKCREDFAIAARGAAILGTLQAGYTTFDYLGPISEKIIRREALLGVSITGMMDSPDIIFDPEMQKEMALLIVKTNEWMAKKIGINPAARTTCVKPSGCRPLNALTTTSNGILTLGEIMENHDIRNKWCDFQDNMTTHGGSIIKTFINGEKEVVKIRLKYGVELVCTPNHPWFVKYRIDRSKKSKRINVNNWVQAQDLQFGDVIDIDLSAYRNKKHSLLKQEYRLKAYDKHLYNCNNIKQPDVMNNDLSWLLGYLWGDGCMKFSQYRLHFIDEYHQHLDKVQRIVKEQFGIDSKLEKCKNKNAYILEFGNKFLWYWLLRNGIYKYEENNIDYIPRIIRESSYDDILAFIAGMIDSDGHVRYQVVQGGEKRYAIIFSTANDKFADHFQQVALSVGLGFSKSLNCEGKNLQKEKHIWLLDLSAHVDRDSFDILSKNSEKIKLLPSGYLWKHEVLSPNVGIFGKVHSVEPIGLQPTFDVETEQHWFYAGAVKTHNTTSCILGTASGVHPHHAKRYIRRVQGNQLEPVLQYFKKFNPHAIEKSVWSANGTDEVVSFVMEVQDGAKTKNQLSAIDLLEYIKSTQQNWVLYGKSEKHCTQNWLCHAVSNTISVRPNEWDEVADYIYKNRKWFAGISLLPTSGDLDYPQAPFTTVHTPAEILREYGEGALFASGLIVDGLHAFDNNLWAACDAVNGLGGDLSVEPTNGEYDFWFAKVDWIRRVKQFAERYLNGEVRRTTYLLKEVNNWKAFLDLKRDYKSVPYEEMYEAENTIQHSETIACAGGACSIYV